MTLTHKQPCVDPWERLTTLGDAGRFAYEMCEPPHAQADPAEMAAAACGVGADSVWEELATLRGPDCYRVASHPLLPEEYQWNFACSGDGTAITGLLANPNCPTAIVDHVINGGRVDGLEHPNVSYGTLVEQQDGAGEVYVARNPKSGPLLGPMATRATRYPIHIGTSIARALATNPATPRDAIGVLLGVDWDDNHYTWALLADHPNWRTSETPAQCQQAPVTNPDT